MKTYVHLRMYTYDNVSPNLLRNTSGEICRENHNTQLIFNTFYFRKSRRLSDNLQKYSRALRGPGSSVGITSD